MDGREKAGQDTRRGHTYRLEKGGVREHANRRIRVLLGRRLEQLDCRDVGRRTPSDQSGRGDGRLQERGEERRVCKSARGTRTDRFAHRSDVMILLTVMATPARKHRPAKPRSASRTKMNGERSDEVARDDRENALSVRRQVSQRKFRVSRRCVDESANLSM
jgi:hypothetical protein